MRLATTWTGTGTRLMGVTDEGLLIDVVDGAADADDLAGVTDLGELLRRGPSAVARVADIIRGADTEGAAALADADLAPPVTHPQAIVCIGRNYMAHIEEGGDPVPELPILFSKYPNTLVGDRDPVVHHAITTALDYEGELALVIGRRASRVPEAEAMAYVAGYTVLNDISARDLQLGDIQWIRGKSLDTFCPLGPVFVSIDEIPDVDSLRIQTRVNGDLRQDAPVSDMIFKIPYLIAFITEAITLEPGDIVATGTPSGVAYGMNPRVYLKPGDAVEVSIDGIGTLHSSIVAP